jgi:RNA polymerase sigma-70 factor (family 1)
MLEDSQLIQLISTGDEMSFTALYRRYWSYLYSTAVKLLRSDDFAMDVVQDVFHSLWIRRETLAIKGSVRGYLYTSVRYKALNIIKKNISDHDYMDILIRIIPEFDHHDAQLLLEGKELEQRINDVVGRMPEKMKKVYNLSRYGNLSHQEISEELGISKETVKKHIQHALCILKKSIKILVLFFLIFIYPLFIFFLTCI